MTSKPSEYQNSFTGPDYDFTVGSICALRAFSLVSMSPAAPIYASGYSVTGTNPDFNPRYRLRGLFNSQWTAGEQVAKCRASVYASDLALAVKLARETFGSDAIMAYEDPPSPGMIISTDAVSGGLVKRSTTPGPLHVIISDPELKHSLEQKLGITPSLLIERRARNTYTVRTPCSLDEPRLDGCTCGFYAYHEGMALKMAHDLLEHEVVAVTEHYGRTLIGTRGLRSTRAKIVAFAISESHAFNLAERLQRDAQKRMESHSSVLGGAYRYDYASPSALMAQTERRLQQLFPDVPIYSATGSDGSSTVDNMIADYPIFDPRELGRE